MVTTIEMGRLSTRGTSDTLVSNVPMSSHESMSSNTLLGVELSSTSTEELESDISVMIAEFSFWQTNTPMGLRSFRNCRKQFIEAARYIRLQNPDIWQESTAKKFREALQVAQAKELKKVIIPYELQPIGYQIDLHKQYRKINRDHRQLNLESFCYVIFAWFCIFTFCYFPWLLGSLLIFLRPFGNDLETLSFWCGSPMKVYVLSFLIIFSLNCVFGCSRALSETVDESNVPDPEDANIEVGGAIDTPSRCGKFLGFFKLSWGRLILSNGVAFVCINLYALTIVWTPINDTAEDPAKCKPLKIFIWAIELMFLIMPIFCFTGKYLFIYFFE